MIWLMVAYVCSNLGCHQLIPSTPIPFKDRQACVMFAQAASEQGLPHRCLEAVSI